jgi:CubicO group peptidase (beta-lactamase class C family)
MNEISQRMQEVLQRAVDSRQAAGVNFLILQNGREVGYAQAGWRNVRKSVPFGRYTIARIYSMTKPITSFAVMKLWEQGRIDFDKRVCEYLPAYDRPDKRDMRVSHLYNMTSGLTYDGGMSPAGKAVTEVFNRVIANLDEANPFTTQQVAAMFAECPLAFEPGTRWLYGVSADVLAAIVEVASGMTFREFLKKELFDPLQLNDTDFYVPEEKQDRLAEAYWTGPEGFKPYYGSHLGVPHYMREDPAYYAGGAGLCSTVDDYARFGQMLLAGGVCEGRRLLKEETVKELLTPHLSAELTQSFRGVFSNHPGFTYDHLIMVCTDPEDDPGEILHKGEYGWNGWLGTTFRNDPETGMTFVSMVQRLGFPDPTQKIRADMKKIVWDRNEK